MKKTAIALITLAAAFSATAAQAAGGCQQKQQAIQQELEMAREYGNKARINGLEKALRENQQHCTDAGLLQSQQEKVAEKQQKVAEREADLQKAQASGRRDKIEKQQRKLTEAREELADAQAELAR